MLQKVLLYLWTILLAMLLLVSFLHPIGPTNQDFWRHLLLGKTIVETHQVPQINLLSYTYHDYPFINSHWLSEVIFYGITAVVGVGGLIVVTASLVLTGCLLLFRLTIKRFSFLISLIIATMYSLLLLERTQLRPELFSFFFFAVFLTILYKYREKPTNLIYLLIPLQLLWVNLHIYFFVGIVLLLFFFLEKRTKTLFLVTLIASLATLCNPNGLQGAIFPLTVLHIYGMPVAENQNIFFLQTFSSQPRILLFELTALLLSSMLVIRRKKTHLTDWLLFCFFTLLTMLHFRNLPLFVFGTFFIFVQNATTIWFVLNKSLKSMLSKRTFIFLKLYSLSVGVLMLIFIIFHTFLLQPIGLGVVENNKGAVDFFVEHHLSGPIYNNFDMGSYLAYRLYPTEKVFVDGRPEAYPKTFFEEIYFPMQENSTIFTRMSNEYGFHTLILSHWDQTPWKNPFLQNLFKNNQYKLVYLDDYALVMLRKDQKKDLQPITENNFQLPRKIDHETTLRYLFFFEKVGWEKQAELAKKRLKSLH